VSGQWGRGAETKALVSVGWQAFPSSGPVEAATVPPFLEACKPFLVLRALSKPGLSLLCAARCAGHTLPLGGPNG
jgi:hypothetical protein